MRRIGFSTGALARGDFRTALAILRQHQIAIVELSALRVEELMPLVTALPSLRLEGFSLSRFSGACPRLASASISGMPGKWTRV